MVVLTSVRPMSHNQGNQNVYQEGTGPAEYPDPGIVPEEKRSMRHWRRKKDHHQG